MQATGTLQETRFSKGFVLVVIAMLCALVLGAAGGYAARSVGQASGGAVQTQHVNAGLLDRGADRGGIAVQGDPQSDLTRVLPTAGPADPAIGYDISQWAGSNQGQPDHGVIP
ncbi:MAG TPA: hypothetical protein VFL27_08735 [Candidatus Dormibacteraeota bacterium]|nr:hypothetical protein [Candidatus Dormibacteraeota bacterium]